MIKIWWLLLIFSIGLSGPLSADEIVLKKSHPTNYVVKKGDTLWDIASRFLRDPWRWPDIWHVNPQIKNPHLIYPGDEVMLTYKDGKPQLVLRRANTSQDNLRVVKLSPGIRKRPLHRAVPTIPIDAIQQFLSRPNVMTEETLDAAPYVLSFPDDRLITGAGNTIYVRGLVPGSNTRYSIIRSGKTYTDDGKSLGVEAMYIGEAVVDNFGDPSTMTITESAREALVGDRLIPAVSQKMEYNFTPHAPRGEVRGKIISVVDGVSDIGQYQIVVINKGLEDGMEKGNVLAIKQKGRKVSDPVEGGKVLLPDIQAGYLLVFRPFNKVSYALIMKATREIRLNDLITNP